MPEPATAETGTHERVSTDRRSRSAPETLALARASVSGNASQATTWIIVTLLAVTLVKQLVLVVSYPPFEGHDEVAHYGYVATLDRERRLPTLADNLPPETGPYSRFTLDWPALYTANHPPLYYLLAWPFYRLAGPDVEARLYAMRLLSVPLFLLVIWLTWRLALLLFPSDPFLALTAPALVAFQPQLSFEGAIVNNDMLSIVFGAALIYLLAEALRRGLTTERALLIGAVTGVGLLAKATVTVFIPLAVAVAIWSAYRSRGAPALSGWLPDAVRGSFLICVPALLISLPWYIFVYVTYGDLTVFRSLDLLQSSWGTPAASLFDLLLSPHFQAERFHEGWGYFGWRLLPLGPSELAFVWIASVVAVAGLAVEGWRSGSRRSSRTIDPDRAAPLVMLIACCVLFYLAMVYFGTRVAFTQTRYVFPAAPAAALLAALGFRALIAARWRPAGATAIVTIALLFQILVLTRIVLPHAMV
jgi:4-amino-4-deoxy-L-arabinose transferase-like glycosyltransferase